MRERESESERERESERDKQGCGGVKGGLHIEVLKSGHSRQPRLK